MTTKNIINKYINPTLIAPANKNKVETFVVLNCPLMKEAPSSEF